MTQPGGRGWPRRIFAALGEAAIGQVGYVPDAGHAKLIDCCRAADGIHAVALTSEQEGVALACGAWLGGARAALLMQSSGVGNCINMLAMARECRFPLLMLVTMRGEWGEFNPWQVPMGRATATLLEHAGVLVERVDRAADAGPTVAAAAGLAFAAERQVAVLIGQRLVGAKSWR